MILARLLRQSIVGEWFVLVLALSATAVAAGYQNWFWRIDQSLYDAALVAAGRAAPEDIVIVAIDDRSLSAMGRWPWPRAVHAALIDRLTEDHVRAVGLDLLLSEPDERDAGGDDALAQAFARNGRVVLPLVMESGSDGMPRERGPAARFAGIVRVGHIHIELDPDGIARSVYLREGAGAARHAHFGVALLTAGTGAEPGSLPGVRNPDPGRPSTLWVRDNWMHIPFAGPPGRFRHVSYVDVLRGDIEPGYFAGKYVLVGVTAAGLGDAYPTPVSGHSQSMAGIEINANVLAAVRAGAAVVVLPWGHAAAVAVGTCLLLLIVYIRVEPRQALLCTALVIAVLVLGAALLPRFAGVWLAPAPALFIAVLAYPLWSWRRLEAAQRFLRDELDRLSREPDFLPATRERPAPFAQDSVARRIAAVREAGDRLRAMRKFVTDSLDGLPHAVLVADRDARIVLANGRVAQFFPDAGPAEGRPLGAVLGLLREEEGAALRDSIAVAAGGAPAPTAEARLPDGREVLVECVPLFGARGRPAGVIVTLVDIAELRNTQRRRDEVMRLLSHDMRAPLSAMITLLDTHREDPAAVDTSRMLDRIGAYARRTLGLADDFLQLARAEHLRPESFEPLELEGVVMEAVDEAWPLAVAKSIEISTAPVADEAWVDGDRSLLRRALVNLLSNAVKYSEPRTRVSVAVRERGPHWCIEISDEGRGIAPEAMPRLFQRFERLSMSGERGIGLGLVMVRAVAEKHGGSVEVESEPGRGSRFTVVLPRRA